MSETKVPTDLLTEVVDFVEGAGQLAAIQEKQAMDVNAQAKVTLDTLKKQGLAQAGVEDSALLAKLANPVEVLKALQKTAALVEVKKIGRSDSEATKTASAAMSADEKFESALGL